MKEEDKLPVSIRLDVDLARRVERAAKKLSSSKSALIRLSLKNQLGEIESGHINFRPENAN